MGQKPSLIVCLVALIAILHVLTTGTRADDDFACSKSGRFADHTDLACKRYYLCQIGNGGKWKKTPYYCPGGTLFDKNEEICLASAKCAEDSSDSSEHTLAYEDGEFVCSKPGRYDDINDPTCSKYYECTRNQHGVVRQAVQYPCPPPSRFDPKRKYCSYKYVCPRHFQCSRGGRFDDATDNNNKRYFLCSIKKNGAFQQTVYSCPFYSRFDAIDNVCAVPDESISDELVVHDPNLPTENCRFICM